MIQARGDSATGSFLPGDDHKTLDCDIPKVSFYFDSNMRIHVYVYTSVASAVLRVGFELPKAMPLFFSTGHSSSQG